MIDHAGIETPLTERLYECNKNIVLYGMGNGAQKILDALGARGIKVSGVFASDGFVRGQAFAGFEVTTYGAACEKFGDMVVLVAFGSGRPDVISNIIRISGEQELYAPDVEVVGGRLFDSGLYKKMRPGLERVYDMLEDERSRVVLNGILAYKLSGKIDYLFNCQSDEEEAYRSILAPSRDEVYVDAGAYDGDSVRSFIDYAGGYKKIYAMEPDERNFRKLFNNMRNLENVELVNAAAHSSGGSVGFSKLAGRQSSVGGYSGEYVDSYRIDSLAPDATFIKMDVEGNERNAIEGGKNVIRNKRPKMLISAYHRHEDLLLPLMIKDMRKDYRVFMRHYPCIPAWDTNYYFI